MVPATTICPAPFMLAAVSPAAWAAARTASGSPPRTALIPVLVTAAAWAIARPRSRTKTMACSAVRTPAPTAAVISPTECPAPAPTWLKAAEGCGKMLSSETRPAPTMSGWAIAVSVIVSASDVVPWAIRSMPLTADSQVMRSAKPGTSSHGVRKPGVWEPCPGATITSTA